MSERKGEGAERFREKEIDRCCKERERGTETLDREAGRERDSSSREREREERDRGGRGVDRKRERDEKR